MLDRRGHLRPYDLPRGKGLGDVRQVSGEFFLSVQKLLQERGDEILNRVADKFPELVFHGPGEIVSGHQGRSRLAWRLQRFADL
jgi:hypothetical protein